MASSRPYYIYNIPYSIQRELCTTLDIDGHWKLLAGSLGFSAERVAHIGLSVQSHRSPTEVLLIDWSHSNATVEQLLFHLQQVGLLRAADKLRGLVPDEAFTNQKPANIKPSPEVDTSGLPKPNELNMPHTGSSNNESRYCKCAQHMNVPVAAAEPQPQHKYQTTCSINGSLPFPDIPKDLKVVRRRQEPVESEDPAVTLQPGSANMSILPPNLVATAINYNFADIKAATHDFSEKNIIGQGGFGVVYSGNLKNTKMAIKKLHQVDGSMPEFFAEILALQKFRHRNIITLCGYSNSGPYICLVYEYMVNGSLLDRLECKDDSPALKWTTRLRILKDAASGLQYLHTVDVKPLIHGDIKSANILLGPHYEAKISDFGLAKEANASSTGSQKYTHVTQKEMTEICGSVAYLPEDFLVSRQLGIKTDVYGFGIVVYETCTGCKVYDKNRKGAERLADHVNETWEHCSDEKLFIRLRDSRASNWPEAVWLRLMQIGKQCASRRKNDRPGMMEVQLSLEKLVTHSQEVVQRLMNRQPSPPHPVVDPYPHDCFDSGKLTIIPSRLCPSESNEDPRKEREDSSLERKTDEIADNMSNDADVINQQLTVKTQPKPIICQSTENRDHSSNNDTTVFIPEIAQDRFTDFLDEAELQRKKKKEFPDFMRNLLEDSKTGPQTVASPSRKISSPLIGSNASAPLFRQAGSAQLPFIPPPLLSSASDRPIMGPPSLTPEDLERCHKLEQLKLVSSGAQ